MGNSRLHSITLFTLLLWTLCAYGTLAFANEQLVLVVAVTRHGDRTPFDQIVNSPIDWNNDAAELVAATGNITLRSKTCCPRNSTTNTSPSIPAILTGPS